MSGERFFLLRSQTSGHVLHLKDADPHPGTRVVVAPPRGKHRNQLFWHDFVTGTIRSKVKDLCLDVYGEEVVVGPYVNGNPNQQWVVAGSRLQNRVNPGWVVEVSHGAASQGDVRATLYTGSAGQFWTVDTPPPSFLRVRHTQSGKLLVPGAATGVALVDEQTCRHLAGGADWYRIAGDVLLTRIGDLAILVPPPHGGAVSMAAVRHGFSQQMLMTSCDHLIDSTNQNAALDVMSCAGETRICVSEKTDSASQKWTFEPVN